MYIEYDYLKHKKQWIVIFLTVIKYSENKKKRKMLLNCLVSDNKEMTSYRQGISASECPFIC